MFFKIDKAKLQKEGIFFLIYLCICQRHFINEKVGNRRNEDHLVFNF